MASVQGGVGVQRCVLSLSLSLSPSLLLLLLLQVEATLVQFMHGGPDFASCSNFNFGEWVDFSESDPRPKYNKVRSFCKTPFANLIAQWAITPALQAFASPLQCSLCDKSFRSKQSLSVHKFKCHNVKSYVRKYVARTFCTVCLREFWSRERCVNHLRYRSKVCLSNMLFRGPLLTDAEADVMDDECKAANVRLQHGGKRRHHVDHPSIRLEGPLEPILLVDCQESSHHPLGVGHNYI